MPSHIHAPKLALLPANFAVKETSVASFTKEISPRLTERDFQWAFS